MSARRTEGQAAPVDPGLRRILLAAAQRLERNGLAASGRLPLLRLESDEVRALSGLLGARWRAVLPGADSSVDLAALDEALRASSASMLTGRGGRRCARSAARRWACRL